MATLAAKMTLRASHLLALFLALLSLNPGTPGFAADPANPFQIRMVRRVTKTVAETKDGWKTGAACIQVDVEFRKQAAGNPFVHVYFFDKNNAKLDGRHEASRVSDDQLKYTGNPERWEPNKIISLCYTITEKVENTTDHFTHVVAVFGNKEMAVAKVYPAGDLKDFDFPEKEKVMKSQSPKALP